MPHNETPICEFSDGEILVRGVPIDTMIRSLSYVESLVLTLTDKEPDSSDLRVEMINAILVAWVDHGLPPPSTQNCINAASVGCSLVHSTAAALMTFGCDHAPVEAAAHFLSAMVEESGDARRMEDLIKVWRIVPGLGHPVHGSDPRVLPLANMAAEFEFCQNHFYALSWAEKHLHGKVRPNLAGITAAIWLDMGFSVETVALVPMAGRLVGLAAHYEAQRKNPKKFAGTP